jgi:hypothetical protein
MNRMKGISLNTLLVHVNGSLGAGRGDLNRNETKHHVMQLCRERVARLMVSRVGPCTPSVDLTQVTPTKLSSTHTSSLNHNLSR